MAHPYVSVIVPAHNAAHQLRITLPALVASTLTRDEWELIVVDDASTDDTALVAAEYADVLLRLPHAPRGPAYARNRGFEVSSGRVLVFTDADVSVHPTALQQFVDIFRRRPEVASVFGSYDDQPTNPGFVSQYRNLMHHYVHHQNAGDAQTFWAGLGAIRARTYAHAGGFDEWNYHRPQIEDIELGRRIRRDGGAILLDPDIQGTHLKKWTLADMLRTDMMHRGVPWAWLLLREQPDDGGATLNLRWTERVCTALVGLGILALGLVVLLRDPWPLVVTVGTWILAWGLNLPFYYFFLRKRGLWFALRVPVLHLAYYLGNNVSVWWSVIKHTLFGKPQPDTESAALAQIGLRAWPPVPEQPSKSLWS